jgi:multidrug efflux pump subunit AcrA (membrane-fusion protein)
MIILLLIAALAGCGRTPTSTPAPVPTTPPARSGPRSAGTTVAASGEVVPARQAELSFTLSGRVHTVAVAEGDIVQPGDLLATLDTAPLDADVARAEAILQAAQAQLALLQAGPRAAQVADAQAQLETAQAQLAQAIARRDQPDLGASQAEVAAAQSQVAAAQAARREADEYHDKTMTCVEVPLSDGQTRKICPVLGTIEEQARYALLAADAAQAAAQAQLDALLAGPDAEERAAQAGVFIAAAQRDAAQAQLDLLQAGPITEQLAVARAAVAQAQVALQAARAARDQATLRAPFPGTIAALEISPGEPAMAGQTVLTLTDLGHLQVETTDLSEQDVDQVQVGQQATVFVEPLGVEIAGHVIDIARQAETVGGDVVYRVVIGLDEQPLGLRWGMSVEVEITTE